MRTEWKRKSLSLFCLALPLVLAGAVAAQSGALSVLGRVQRVDDPELGELIRVAMENRHNANEKEAFEIIRKVTQGYAQVRLLDRQIEQVSRRIESTAGPAELRYELLLARAELETKLMTELATLREVMGVMPKHAFDKKPIDTLNAWLALNMIDERVYVLDALKPFSEYWASWRWQSAGLLSEGQTLDYIRQRLRKRDNLPIRIDIYHTSALSVAAGALRARIVSLIGEMDAHMDAEVRTELSTWVGSGESTFFLRDGQVRTLYPAPVKRPDGGGKPLITGLVNPNDLEQHILWRLLMPKNVPLKFRVEYDEASALVAKQVAETAKTVAKRLGIAEVVEVAEILVEPFPEAQFFGRWQGVADAEVREIELRPDGQSRLTMRKGAQKVVPAPWTLTTKEIFIDSSFLVTYLGYINAEGNLIVDKGEIWPQGSWHDRGSPAMVFTKVE